MPAARGSSGDWIHIASAVEPEISAASRAERRDVLARAAERYRKKPSTIHRMVRAYTYIVTRAKGVGVEMTEIAAPVVCIEVLERLERKGEPLPPDLRRRVLLGEVSFQELRDEEAAASAVCSKRLRESQMNWYAFAIELADDLFPNGWSSSRFTADRGVYSQAARNISVDWEVERDGLRIALFLSPQIVYSEFRGRAVIDQLPRVVMATLFYDEVQYVVWDEAEARLAASYLPPEARRSELLPVPLLIVPFLDTPQGRVNGDVYQV